jgi:hypothetical protein
LNAEFLFSIYAGCVAGHKVGINKERNRDAEMQAR